MVKSKVSKSFRKKVIKRTERGYVLSPFNKSTKQLIQKGENVDFFSWFVSMKNNNKSSWVYKHFNAHENGVKCMYCDTFYDYEDFEIYTAGNHIKKHQKTDNSSIIGGTSNTNANYKSLACVFEGLPFKIVEGYFFRKLLQDCRNQNKEIVPIHSAEYISKNVNSLSKKMKLYIKEELLNVDYVSLCIDCWISKYSMQFIGVTVHWINEKTEPTSRMILCKHLNREGNISEPASNSIATILKNMIDNYMINKKIVCITTDQGKDIVSALKILGLQDKWYNCWFHRLNLCYSKSFNATQIENSTEGYQISNSSKKLIKKFQKLISKTRSSYTISESFKERNINKIPSFSFTKLGGFIESMVCYINDIEEIQTILKNKVKKDLLLSDKENMEINCIKSNLFDHLSYILNLEREEEVTITLSLVLEERIRNSFNKFKMINKLEFPIAFEILKDFEERFNYYFSNQLTNFQKIVYFLEPMSQDKLLNYNIVEVIDLIKSELEIIEKQEVFKFNDLIFDNNSMEDEIVEEDEIYHSETSSNVSDNLSIDEDNFSTDTEEKNKILKFNPKIYSKKTIPTIKDLCYNSLFDTQTDNDKQTDILSTIDIEINNYLIEKKNTNMSAKEFWKARSFKYPKLYKLALKFLCSQPTSISIEHCWGNANIEEKRGRLSDISLENQILLRSNKKLSKLIFC